MDSSSPVSRDDFQTQKDVVKSIMKSFYVRRGQSRAAVITYGRYSEKLLRFNSYLSLNDIESVVDTATSIGGSPRIEEVLVDAADVLRDAIQSIPRIVIMFTTVRDLTDRHKKAVDKAAEVIHDTGARVYVIAFGKDVDDLSLKKLADSQEDIFKVPTIKDLNDSMAVEIFRRVGKFFIFGAYCNRTNQIIFILFFAFISFHFHTVMFVNLYITSVEHRCRINVASSFTFQT